VTIPCDHDWKPVPDKFGRYQCSKCGVLGYRAAFSGRPQADNSPDRGTIVPYKGKSPKLPWGTDLTARPKGTPADGPRTLPRAIRGKRTPGG